MFMKKASLNLSVNAIVVLILAITMLGLGLGFMKNTFGGVTEQFEQVSGDLERQLIQELENKGLPASFSVYSMDMTRSETKSLFFAVKAAKAGVCAINYVPSGGCTSMSGPCTIAQSPPAFTGFVTTPSLAEGETKVLPLKISTAGTTPDTYILTVLVSGCFETTTENPGMEAELVVEVR